MASILPQIEKDRKFIISCSSRSIILYFLVFLIAYVAALSILVDLHYRERNGESSSSSASAIAVVKPQLQTDVDSKRNRDRDSGNDGHHDIQNDVFFSENNNNINNGNIIRNDDATPMTIGVASTVTGCTESPFQDGAAVLKYSLDRHSAAYGNGKYNYQSYILYHPNATQCVLPLRALGFTLLERSLPVQLDEIQGDDLRERIVTNGCCGEVSYVMMGK
jgi:hypothetical protein